VVLLVCGNSGQKEEDVKHLPLLIKFASVASLDSIITTSLLMFKHLIAVLLLLRIAGPVSYGIYLYINHDRTTVEQNEN
jgi:hypothetical protein